MTRATLAACPVSVYRRRGVETMGSGFVVSVEDGESDGESGLLAIVVYSYQFIRQKICVDFQRRVCLFVYNASKMFLQEHSSSVC